MELTILVVLFITRKCRNVTTLILYCNRTMLDMQDIRNKDGNGTLDAYFCWTSFGT